MPAKSQRRGDKKDPLTSRLIDTATTLLRNAKKRLNAETVTESLEAIRESDKTKINALINAFIGKPTLAAWKELAKAIVCSANCTSDCDLQSLVAVCEADATCRAFLDIAVDGHFVTGRPRIAAQAVKLMKNPFEKLDLTNIIPTGDAPQKAPNWTAMDAIIGNIEFVFRVKEGHMTGTHHRRCEWLWQVAARNLLPSRPTESYYQSVRDGVPHEKGTRRTGSFGDREGACCLGRATTNYTRGCRSCVRC
ncbi:Hypothetical protein, putative [Bodo saltans]|uniref:Uncharacterized protein n=1 Tax=Bodo saltans TaxID=75058 RepID=A0A0S4JP37_BODSA|nr:Hypothetical protein, putative [Bodo saltans]|eukprot:CUG92434.1 Hypothetical protein, putative [Bodo saltans]